MTSLVPENRDERLLARIKETVRAVEPTAHVVLYGSRARGEARPESDWDIVVLVDGPVDGKRMDRIWERLYALELETGAVIGSVVVSKEDWESPLYRAMPFHENVMQEGIELAGDEEA